MSNINPWLISYLSTAEAKLLWTSFVFVLSCFTSARYWRYFSCGMLTMLKAGAVLMAFSRYFFRPFFDQGRQWIDLWWNLFHMKVAPVIAMTDGFMIESVLTEVIAREVFTNTRVQIAFCVKASWNIWDTVTQSFCACLFRTFLFFRATFPFLGPFFLLFSCFSASLDCRLFFLSFACEESVLTFSSSNFVRCLLLSSDVLCLETWFCQLATWMKQPRSSRRVLSVHSHPASLIITHISRSSTPFCLLILTY